jgi:hypothetical protein
MLVLTLISIYTLIFSILYKAPVVNASPCLRICTSIGYLCHTPIHAVLGGIVGAGNSVTDTPLSSWSSCGNVEKKDESSVDDGDLACEVSEGA